MRLLRRSGSVVVRGIQWALVSVLLAACASPPLPRHPTGEVPPGFVGMITPHPPYPLQARAAHITGTVIVRVTFAAAGPVRTVKIMKSSGSEILDSNTVNYIKAKWRSTLGKEYTKEQTLSYFLVQPTGI